MADCALVDFDSMVYMTAQIPLMDKVYTAACCSLVSYRKLFSVTQHEKSRLLVLQRGPSMAGKRSLQNLQPDYKVSFRRVFCKIVADTVD